MLVVAHPPGHDRERQYVFDVVLRDFLGLEYEAICCGGPDVRITLREDPDRRVLVVGDVLLQTSERDWCTTRSLPTQPLDEWEVADRDLRRVLVFPSLPVIYGVRLGQGRFCQDTERGVRLGLDVFGSAFFMLSRYEEIVKTDRDRHGRFPAAASLAVQEQFIMRPIVNEYVEVLWWYIVRLWPGLRRTHRQFSMFLTHDVDYPFYTTGKIPLWVARDLFSDVLKRRNLALASERIRSALRVRSSGLKADMYNTFDFIMDTAEENRLRSAFYFIADTGVTYGNAVYSLDDGPIRSLLRRMHQRGHEVGLHGSYGSFRSSAQILSEFRRLLRVCGSEGVIQSQWGGRQHFLQWDAYSTWRYWHEAGLDYDSSVGYAEQPGFRAGVCYEYPTFDISSRRTLQLRERPLVLMDTSLFGQPYMRMDYECALGLISELKARCAMFRGTFTVLWHNSSLAASVQKELYTRAVARL